MIDLTGGRDARLGVGVQTPKRSTKRARPRKATLVPGPVAVKRAADRLLDSRRALWVSESAKKKIVSRRTARLEARRLQLVVLTVYATGRVSVKSKAKPAGGTSKAPASDPEPPAAPKVKEKKISPAEKKKQKAAASSVPKAERVAPVREARPIVEKCPHGKIPQWCAHLMCAAPNSKGGQRERREYDRKREEEK